MYRVVVAALLAALFALPAEAVEKKLNVLATIKPVHAIVATVMGNTGKPELLMPGGASPHSYALKPSDARKLASADVIFWVGPELENFLEHPLKTLAPHARVAALANAEGVLRLPTRKGGLWEGETKPAREPAQIDGHVWLDPRNATAMAYGVAKILSEADPARMRIYAGNAAAFEERMKHLDDELAAELAPIRARPYIVFHDAFHYFELRYGLSPAGAVTVASDRPVGAARIESLRNKIKQTGTICVFSTPQYPPKLIATLTEGTRARVGILDDIGADIAPGQTHYETLMRRIAGALTSCLSPRTVGKFR